MNSVLLTQDDIISEIKEMVKDMENIKAGVDMFGEMIKNKISEQVL